MGCYSGYGALEDVLMYLYRVDNNSLLVTYSKKPTEKAINPMLTGIAAQKLLVRPLQLTCDILIDTTIETLDEEDFIECELRLRSYIG